MAARTFVETGANQVAIIDLNEDDSKRAATEMVDWFGTLPARSSHNPGLVTFLY
jgi:hypothetical protein